ncbi:unnamed protein product [Lymnaea stagnalis]|uniref:Uncharacterized protein n=1 Tax=Lymnaea stagnalis TaxID=6523 RepID=A0AAV2IN07_LYMST
MAASKEYLTSVSEVDTGSMLKKFTMSTVIKWKKHWLLLMCGLFLALVTFYLSSEMVINKKFNINPVETMSTDHSHYAIWPNFEKNSAVDSDFFKSTCAKNVNFSITGLVDIKKQWAKSKNSNCQALFDKFTSMFTIDARKASLSLPSLFKKKVKGWLANNEQLYQEVFDQDVIHVISEFTHEHTVFNPLRDKRPVSPPKEPENSYFSTLLKESSDNCDFCNYKDYTAEHTFGRVESKHSFSASNIFKIDTLHAILALKKHDPLHWKLEEFLDLFQLVNTWIGKANKNYPNARYPGVAWDVLPKCGASQVHPHLHVVLDLQRYPGTWVVETWRRGAQEFYEVHNSNYFSDLVAVYSALNLTVTYGTAVAFASLVPRKDHEIVVMSERASSDFYILLYFVLRGLIDDVHKMCFSMGIALPAVNVAQGKLPAYARVITRGYVTDIRADISSLEMFLATNVNIDPYKTVEIVRNSMKARIHEVSEI